MCSAIHCQSAGFVKVATASDCTEHLAYRVLQLCWGGRRGGEDRKGEERTPYICRRMGANPLMELYLPGSKCMVPPLQMDHKDSFTSLPPPPTWRCLQPLPWHGHQDGLHHVEVVQHSCSGPHGERGTQRSAKGLTAWIMQTLHQMGSTYTHVQWGGGRGVCRLGEMEQMRIR